MDTTEKDIRDLFVSSKPLDRDEVAMLLLQLVERIQNLERAPKRKPLTDAQMLQALNHFAENPSDYQYDDPLICFARAIEQAHGIKE